MGRLTEEEIRLILDRIGRKVVVKSSDNFPFDIVEPRSQGYSDDPDISHLQTKLSMMLRVAA